MTGLNITYNNIGSLYYEQGKNLNALRYYKQSLKIADKIGFVNNISIAYGNIGTVYHDMNNIDLAIKYYEKSTQIAKQINNGIGVAVGNNNIGTGYYDKDDFTSALKYYKDSLAAFEHVNFVPGIGSACLKLGQVYLELGKHTKASKYLKSAEIIFKKTSNIKNLIRINALFSELSLKKKDYRKAHKFAQEALSLAIETGARAERILALRTMSKILFATIKQRGEKSEKRIIKTKKFLSTHYLLRTTKKAIAFLEEAVSLARAHNMQLDLAKSLYELARIYHESRRCKMKGDVTKKIMNYLEGAERIFKKAGAKLWLKKVVTIQNKIVSL
ncbi:MAG: tetratricopeptide repeat protein [candidate division WOR-3 bacterium]